MDFNSKLLFCLLPLDEAMHKLLVDPYPRYLLSDVGLVGTSLKPLPYLASPSISHMQKLLHLGGLENIVISPEHHVKKGKKIINLVFNL